ncbi:hypothetical protein chiPu_0023651, partial [Chiloscyllium punctatum]|nr:hypothetical protein [Chiloscyllium punctatum]
MADTGAFVEVIQAVNGYFTRVARKIPNDGKTK